MTDMPHTISPGGILRALDYLAENKVEMHSLLVAEKGKLCCEAYWDPWKRDSLHRMYSVTKSFVSIAIGCLEHDGLISIDDRIAAYFPEYASLPPELSLLTIRNMLMMRTCYRTTTYKAGGRSSYIPSWQKEWVRSFFSSKPDHDPGMFFIYDTSSTHVLASLVERVSGTDFVSFIRSTFLSGLDISGDTYITKDPEGRPAGGSGLMMRPIDLLKVIDDINANDKIHGVLMFRPLPKHLKADQDEICNRLDPRKDVDGMTDGSNAGVFMGKALGFAPCTPAACMEILDHYGIDCTGKKAVVIGRSLVVGKPAAIMLMGKNATVTVCHTRTKDVPAVAREADILVSAAGVLKSLTKDYVRPGQIVIDVSINWDEAKGGIAGDAVFDEVEPIVEAITPVPGGVGAVTTSVLIGHVVEAAKRMNP